MSGGQDRRTTGPGHGTAGRQQGHRPSLVLADDEPDVVFLLERLLGDAFEFVAAVNDGAAAVEAVRRTRPDVVLLDLTMPRLDGQAALPEILRSAPNTMVAILSAYLDDDRVRGLLLAGAFAAYPKDDLREVPDMLHEDLARFRRVLAGEDDVPAWKHRLQPS